jgi:hypothetical protein
MTAPILRELWRAVERRHRGLGQLVLSSVLSAYARRTLLVVAMSGSGKSTAGSVLEQVVPDVASMDTLTIPGLKKFLDTRGSIPSVLLVDDLAKTPYPLTRMNTLVTVSELVYSGWVSRHVWKESFELTGVKTSGIINVQPKVLASIVPLPEWTATLRDKTIRYWHFRLPSEFRPHVEVEYPQLPPIPDELPPLKVSERHLGEVAEWGHVQWTPGRARLHVSQLARAHAFLAGKPKATLSDVQAVLRIFAPIRLEALLIRGTESAEDYIFSFQLFAPTAWTWTHGYLDVREFSKKYMLPRSLTEFLIEKCVERQILVRTDGVVQLAPVVRKVFEEVYMEHPKWRLSDDRTRVPA